MIAIRCGSLSIIVDFDAEGRTGFRSARYDRGCRTTKAFTITRNSLREGGDTR
jgi:hypothetical protein